MTDGEAHGGARVPAWLAYLLTAILWPLWCEAGVLVAGLGGEALTRAGFLGSAAVPLAIGVVIVVWALVSFRAGRFLATRAPGFLWVVAVVWLGVITAVAVLAAGLADVRSALGLLGVLGPFLFGAIGFAAGMRRAR